MRADIGKVIFRRDRHDGMSNFVSLLRQHVQVNAESSAMDETAERVPMPNIFLHGGPGLSCFAEREHYGSALSINWWDQPGGTVLFARPFSEPVEMTEDVVVERTSHCRQPVGLVAHSFGALLALNVAARIPQHIHGLTLLAPVHNVIDALTRVGRCVVERLPHASSLTRVLGELAARPDDRNCFWSMVNELSNTPDFLRVYFRDDAGTLYATVAACCAAAAVVPSGHRVRWR